MSNRTPDQTSIPGGPERGGGKGPDLLARVNRQLGASMEASERIGVSPDQLTAYIKSLALPAGARFESLNAAILQDRLTIQGQIKARLRSKADFSVLIINDLKGTLNVVNHTLDLGGAARAKRGDVERMISRFDELMLDEINERVDPKWEVTGAQIRNDKVEFIFERVGGATVVARVPEDSGVGVVRDVGPKAADASLGSPADGWTDPLRGARFKDNRSSADVLRAAAANPAEALELEAEYADVLFALRHLPDEITGDFMVPIDLFLYRHYGVKDWDELAPRFGGFKPSDVAEIERASEILEDMGAKELPALDPEVMHMAEAEMVIGADPEDALDEHGNFDSARWQKFKRGTLFVPAVGVAGTGIAARRREFGQFTKMVGRGPQEAVQYGRKHRAQALLATLVIAGTAAGIWAVYENGENAPVQPGYEAPVTFSMPAVPATPAKPEALPAGPELPVVTKTGSLPDNLTVKLVDLVGADLKPGVAIAEQPGANDLKLDIKIVKPQNLSWSCFDYSVGIAFQKIGINLFDANNPSLNAETRWQLTTMIAHAMGLEPSQLSLVFEGDEFKGIEITPEIVAFIKGLNVEIPDSVLRTAGLVSLPASELKPVETVTTAATINPEAAPVAQVKTPMTPGAAAVATVVGRTQAQNNASIELAKAPVDAAQAKSLKLDVPGTFNIDELETAGGLNVVTLSDQTKVNVDNEVAVTVESIQKSKVAAIAVVQKQNNFYYSLVNRTDDISFNLKFDDDKRVLVFAAAVKQKEDEEKKKEEERSFLESILSYLNADNAPSFGFALVGLSGLSLLAAAMVARRKGYMITPTLKFKKIDDDEEDEPIIGGVTA